LSGVLFVVGWLLLEPNGLLMASDDTRSSLCADEREATVRQMPLPAPPPERPATDEPPARMGLAILVGVVGVCVNAVLVAYVGGYLLGSNLGVDYLPIGVFCLFVVLVGMNSILRHVGLGLTRRELAVAYVTMLITSDIAGSAFAMRLVPSLVAVFYYATPMNDWDLIFVRYIPTWATPHDREVIRQYYEGISGGPIPWGAWFLPLATWLVPWVAMLCLMFGLGVLLRKRWLERERLTFPLAQVPLAVLGEEAVPGFNTALRRDVVFWIAFAVPFVVRMLQGLHHYRPAVPTVTLVGILPLSSMFQNPSWQSLFDTTSFEIHLALVGIAVLMRQEVSASFWVFEWFYLGVGAILYLIGFGAGTQTNTPQETFGYVMFIYYSRLGGTLAAATILLWAIREQIARAWKLLWHPLSAEDGDDRLLRWVAWLILAGAVLYLGWAYAGGMNLRAALVVLGVHVAVLVVLARIIADGGLFWASLSLDPMRCTVRFLGTDWMSGDTLTFLAFSNQVPMAARANLLPSIMDSFQIGNKTGVRTSRLLWGMVIGVAVATVVSLAVVLWMSYTYGALTLDQGMFLSTASFPFEESANYLTNPATVNVASIWTTALGAALMVLFITLHRRFPWWPVYPLGFALAESATMEHMWLSVFLGWVIHVLIVRVWGGAGYRRIKPAAFGLVVGDFLSIGMWTAIDLVTGSLSNRMSHEVSTW